MNSFSQLIVSCISMSVLVKCSPLGYGLEDSASLGYGSSGGDDYGHSHEHKHEPGMPYKFGYKVYDPKHGTDFSQNEHSDGDNVKGEYQVLLPDGRVQQVSYTADWKTGYHADVQYHGKAIDTSSYGGDYGSSGHSYETSDHGGYSPSYSSGGY